MKKTAFLAIILLLAGCLNTVDEQAADETSISIQRPDTPSTIPAQNQDAGSSGLPPSNNQAAGSSYTVSADDAKTSSVVDANNEFAIKLYRKLSQEGGSVFFSPFSISTALAMTFEGANGTTAEQMRKTLLFPKDDETRLGGYLGLLKSVKKPSASYQLSTANALWVQKDYRFLDKYLSDVGTYYMGKANLVDFVSETEKSRLLINDWVEGETNDKIKDLIPPGVLNSLTRMVLTNAVYFKGRWKTQFDPKNTRDDIFWVTDTTSKDVKMMSITGSDVKFDYYSDGQLQAVRLPYDGERLSMTLILPAKGGMGSFEGSFDASRLHMIQSSMRPRNLKVYIPKFKFKQKTMLSSTLSQMGMPEAFSMSADFSKMDGGRDLFIKSVIHQAFVEVNEEGTEAAAATAVVMQLKSMPSRDSVFRADRPFIFLIQDDVTGQILFMGKMTDPS